METPPLRVTEYRLVLDVDAAALLFQGEVELLLEGSGTGLRLNAVGLTLDSVRCGDRPVDCRVEEAEEAWHLSGIPAEERSVRLRYHGSVSSGTMTGLYRSRFGSGTLLTTDLAPTSARRLLPCVDEPAAKAVFRLTVRADPTLDVVSNGEAQATRLLDGRRETAFAPTPPMATYLLYLGIGGFDELRASVPSPRVRLVAPPGRAREGRFAVELAEKALARYEEYYGIPYPLPKLHLVSVPEINWGAMENWGAIAFRETRLLVDETTTTDRRLSVANTVTHELAHQWFGNLVTMRWWDDLWLNESFATFVGHKMLDMIDPASDAWAEFLVTQTGHAITGDALAATHPIHARVDRAADANELFDEISYGKGASVLRMIEGYLGDATFRRGVRSYLERFRFGNARAEDLWEALGEAAGAPVGEWMDAWIRRPGHPMITVRAEEGRLRLSQRRFRLDGQHSAETWPVPLSVRVDGVTSRHLLRGAENKIDGDPREELVVNADALGFFRVLYTGRAAELFERCRPGLSARERWASYRDDFGFLLSGDLEPQRYLERLGQARGEHEYLTARAIVQQLATLSAHLHDRPRFRDAAVGFLRPQAERLGPERKAGEPSTDGSLRSAVAAVLVTLDPSFRREAAGRFARLDAVDADIRPAVLVAYSGEGGEAAARELEAEASATESDSERFEIESALAWSSEPKVVTRTLERSLSGEVNRAHLARLILTAATNPVARAETWDWLASRFDRVVALHAGGGIVGSILEGIIPILAVGREEELRGFLGTRAPPEGRRGVEKGWELYAVFRRLHERVA